MNRRKITIYKSLLFGALCAATMAASPDFAHAALGLDFSALAPYENGGPTTFGAAAGFTTVGWSFTANSDLYLTKLGVYDADKDRIHSEQHQVGIWSAGSLLASLTIPETAGNIPVASAPGKALFHYGTLDSQLLLHKGQTYYVGATLYSGTVTAPGSMPNSTDFDMFASINDSDGVPVAVNPSITYLNSAYAINANTNQLSYPGTVYDSAKYAVGANIDVISADSANGTPTPIPAAVWLFGSGLMGLVGVRKKQK